MIPLRIVTIGLIYCTIVSSTILACNIQIRPDIPANKSGYIPMSNIYPGQNRYSQEIVENEMQKAITKKEAVTENSGAIILKYDDGNSAFPLEDAISVMRINHHYTTNYIALDGHHKTIANKRLGGSTMPVKVVLEVDKSYEEAVTQAKTANIVYYKEIGGKDARPIRRWKNLIDDPYHTFVKKHAIEIQRDGSINTNKIKLAFWIKSVDIDRNFIELLIADHLHNLKFDVSANIPEAQKVKQAWQLLLNNPLPTKNPLYQVSLVPANMDLKVEAKLINYAKSIDIKRRTKAQHLSKHHSKRFLQGSLQMKSEGNY